MLWLGLALATPEVVTSTADTGKLADRVTDAPADLILLYGGEQDGDPGTCGCPGDPRGSLGRVHSWATRARERGDPVLLLNPGNWLTDPVGAENRLRADAMVRNAEMLALMEGWDALNLSFRDLPYLGAAGLLDTLPPGAVSANASRSPSVVRHEVNGLGVAVVGLTAWKKDYLQPDDVVRIDPIDALRTLLPTLGDDLVVVLSYGLGARNKEVAALDVDVLIDADTHRSNVPALVVDDTVWVRSRFGTEFLGELRLEIDNGAVIMAHDRMISMDGRIPVDRAWRKRLKQNQRALERL